MSHADRRKLFERAAFMRFCEVQQFQIEPDSLRQPELPTPDILVKLRGRGEIAFELVSLEDDAQTQRMNLMMAQSGTILTNFRDSLPAQRRADFDRRFGDTAISVHIASARGSRDIQGALDQMSSRLMTIPEGFTGPAFANHPDKIAGVDRVYIARDPTWTGPQLSTTSGGYVLRLNLGKLQEKMRKTYDCAVPVELLAYAAEVAHLADETEIPRLVRDLLPQSGYRGVWIFEDLLRRATCYDR
jgi:hypothetical protein